MYNTGVVCLDVACRGARDDEDFDLVPPPADGAVELVRLRPCCGLHQNLEVLFRGGGIGEGARAQQNPELLLDFPHGLGLACRVVSSEDLDQMVRRVPGQGVAGAQSSIRCAQALSIPRPRRPLTCWDRFWRASVIAWLASETRWK